MAGCPALSIDSYCVVGCPVAHSKSPQIHSIFAKQTHQNISYRSILVEKGKFDEAVIAFRNQGGKGLNVTLPFKGDAWKIASHKSYRAERALAVNTVSFGIDGQIIGDNTDGIGLVRDLTINHAVAIKDKDILILGAGGAVRGVLGALLDAQPNSVVIANRTVSRAQSLVKMFTNVYKMSACGFNDLDSAVFDIVINGTSTSLQGKIPPLPEHIFKNNSCCYDMMYTVHGSTIFTEWADAHGAGISLDGLGMLIEQAAESFFIWRNIRPDTAGAMKLLKSLL